MLRSVLLRVALPRCAEDSEDLDAEAKIYARGQLLKMLAPSLKGLVCCPAARSLVMDRVLIVV